MGQGFIWNSINTDAYQRLYLKRKKKTLESEKNSKIIFQIKGKKDTKILCKSLN